MRRRAILAAAAGLAPLSALGQAERRVPVVGFLGFASSASDRVLLDALKRGMTEIGHVEGRSYLLEARHAEGRIERAPELIADLIERRVAVFVAPGQAAARILARTTKLPVVAVALPSG